MSGIRCVLWLALSAPCIRIASIIIVCTSTFNHTAAQVPLVTLEKEFLLQSSWQEYMPDVYTVDDSVILMAGLNTNMSNLTMNFFLRWMTMDGNIIREKEIFNVGNPDGYSFALETYYTGSARDADHVYLISATHNDSCHLTGDPLRAYRMIKVRLSDGFVDRDTVLCFDGVRIFSALSTSAQEDSLYLYGSLGYLNQRPDIVLATMTKDFRFFSHQKLRTTDTHVMPLGIGGDSRAVAGSHYRYDDGYYDNFQDIWYGRIAGDTILESGRIEYGEQQVLWKPFVLDSTEKAFLGFNLRSSAYESSMYLLRNDTLAWNFYDAFLNEITDIFQSDSQYVILQASFREDDDRKDKIILHYLDHDGFPFGRDEFVTPWIRYAHGGMKINGTYFAFVAITDWDEIDRVGAGEILLEEAHWDYTHVLKFRINE